MCPPAIFRIVSSIATLKNGGYKNRRQESHSSSQERRMRCICSSTSRKWTSWKIFMAPTQGRPPPSQCQWKIAKPLRSRFDWHFISEDVDYSATIHHGRIFKSTALLSKIVDDILIYKSEELVYSIIQNFKAHYTLGTNNPWTRSFSILRTEYQAVWWVQCFHRGLRQTRCYSHSFYHQSS